ncbi:hypothetical protein JCM21900_003335 [Sporobolomyces salmonicolor]
MATVKPEDASSSPAPCKFEVITIVDIDGDAHTVPTSPTLSTEPVLATTDQAAGHHESDREHVPSTNPRDEGPVSLETKHEGEGVDVVSVVNKYPPSPHASDTSSFDELKRPKHLRLGLTYLAAGSSCSPRSAVRPFPVIPSFPSDSRFLCAGPSLSADTNTFGVFQAYYMQTIYSSYSDSAISWIVSVQLGLFFLALAAGPLFDNEHPHSLLRCRAQADGTLSQRANSAFSSLSDRPIHLGPFNFQTTCCYAMTSSGAIVVFAILYGLFSGGFISLLSSVVVSISNDRSEIGLRHGIAFLIVAGAAVGGNPLCRRLPSEHSNDFKYLIVFAGTMVCAGAAVTAVGRCLWAKEKGTWKA